MPATRADVLLTRELLEGIQPPPTSIVDGGPGGDVVQVCCLHAAGVSRFVVSLRVDEATANRFARACRLMASWQRRVIPAILAIAALALLPAVIGMVRYDLALVLLSAVAELCLAIVAVAARLVLIGQRSRHHPVLARHGKVLIRDVDRASARAWADLNTAGSVEI